MEEVCDKIIITLVQSFFGMLIACLMASGILTLCCKF